ncbi:hypothetical protein FRC12_015862 [Ceratobasidium sp. 428]|nr:hypothetical protein FRC12_015862 [Ceratobasidium sp. 428]
MGNSGSGTRKAADIPLAFPAERLPLRRYYSVVLALARGSKRNRRPGLPEELVLLICRFANFHCLSPEYTVEENTEASVHARDAQVASTMWARSPALDARMASHIHSIQLFTDSKHQGWVSNPSAGSWSWFEIGVCRVDEGSGNLNPKTQPDGSPAFWLSHDHPVRRQDGEDKDGYKLRVGKRFGVRHPIWGYVEEGDILVVELKAQFPGWANYVRRGVLRVSTWWQPSAAMLNLAYNK